MVLTNSAHCISIRQVQVTVARAFDLTVAEMLSSSRTRRVTRARHVAMYLSREVAVRRARPADRAETPGTLPPPSFPRLGLAFARDHSSVIYACRIVRRRLRDDLGFATLLDRLAGDLHLRAALAAAPASDVQLHAALAATTQEAAHSRVAFAADPASDLHLRAALAATTQEAA